MGNEFTIPETLIVGSKAAFGELERMTADIANELEAVNDSGDASIGIIADSAGSSTLNFGDDDNEAGQIIFDHTANQLQFKVGGTTLLSIDALGTTIGDLVVPGTTTTVNTADLNITDNVILLNKDEVGAGVTLGIAGIEIERGSVLNAGWFYNEAEDWWGPTGPAGILGVGGATQVIGNIEAIDTTTADNILTINGSGAITVPAGNTAARPSSPVNGMVRYSSILNNLEGYINGNWEELLNTGSSVTISGDLTMDTGAQFFLDDGDATDPGLAFANDTDTGIFLVGGDSIGFSAGTSELFRIGPTEIDAFANLDMNDFVLFNPKDPVLGNEVGDRDFNDGRYVNVDGDTMTGKLTLTNASRSLDVERTTTGTAMSLILDKASVIGERICLNFVMEDDAAASIDYGRICTEIVDDATGFTEGKMRFSLTDGTGSLATAAILNADGIMEVTATAALYSDLAERYAADMDLEPGTVVVFGGEAEITMSSLMEDTAVAGVISTDPAIMMNSGAGEDKTHPYVALKGRVPCKVTGPIKKGDLLITATLHGHAMSVGKRARAYTAFARALENFNGGTGVIEVAII